MKFRSLFYAVGLFGFVLCMHKSSSVASRPSAARGIMVASMLRLALFFPSFLAVSRHRNTIEAFYPKMLPATLSVRQRRLKFPNFFTALNSAGRQSSYGLRVTAFRVGTEFLSDGVLYDEQSIVISHELEHTCVAQPAGRHPCNCLAQSFDSQVNDLLKDQFQALG